MRKKPGEYSIEDGVEIEWVTKSEMKREMDRLDKLGRLLISLTSKQLGELNLSEQLHADINLAIKIQSKHEAFRRQLQLIGKRLRYEDTDIIYAAIEVMQNKHLRVTKNLHNIENIRDEIIAKGDEAIDHLLENHPSLDRQKIRQLSRQATKETTQNKPPKASRELFKYLNSELNLELNSHL